MAGTCWVALLVALFVASLVRTANPAYSAVVAAGAVGPATVLVWGVRRRRRRR